MSENLIEVQRPDRWDHPLSDEMSDERVLWLMHRSPFRDMNAELFSRSTPLEDILRNDTRLHSYQAGDLVFREGQYGGSAYLVLDGSIRIALSQLLLDDDSRSKKNNWMRLWEKLPKQLLRRGQKQSRRAARMPSKVTRDTKPVSTSSRGVGNATRIFLQDVPGVLDEHATSEIGVGELFGEMSAVTRSPREYTAFAEGSAQVLEVRWQGLKLLKQDPAFRSLLDERYRGGVLKTHLRETKLFRFLPEEQLEQVVASARLESFGNLEWYADYRKGIGKPAKERISKEPLIAEEGTYATGLWIIRGGFARLSRRQGAGHRTLAYLGKGEMFGLQELVHNQNQSGSAPLPYQESLRAIGYVDALCIPKQTVTEHILPFVRRNELPPQLQEARYQFGQPVIDAPLEIADHSVDTGLLEFLVDRRLMNGQKTMVIDTERCTRCDDCVKACASTHGGTPVFIREGAQYGPWMFAQACMHCEDPVCMIGCPTGAIHRDRESGLVNINEQTCIGCKGCAESCPYDNIRMVTATDGKGRAKLDHDTGLPILQASKCDMCSSAGGRPSCQAACPHDALVRIDLSDLGQVNQTLRKETQS